MGFKQSPLPYEFNALEPFIDEQTMHLHYEKHHAGYVAKLNDALAGNQEFENMSPEELIHNLGKIPEDKRTLVHNNAGGHYNHEFFWTIMAPKAGGRPPEGDLLAAITARFGSFEQFQKTFAEMGVGRFGSGWVWLVVPQNGPIDIMSTANQDTPIMDGGPTPILGLDVWEHAYYLKYQNKRPEYIEYWWNLVNWPEVTRRYEAALADNEAAKDQPTE